MISWAWHRGRCAQLAQPLEEHAHHPSSPPFALSLAADADAALQSLHWLRWRPCSQIEAPPQSLHWLRTRPCSQIEAPPQSLHLLRWRPCSHSLRPHLSRSTPSCVFLRFLSPLLTPPTPPRFDIAARNILMAINPHSAASSTSPLRVNQPWLAEN